MIFLGLKMRESRSTTGQESYTVLKFVFPCIIYKFLHLRCYILGRKGFLRPYLGIVSEGCRNCLPLEMSPLLNSDVSLEMKGDEFTCREKWNSTEKVEEENKPNKRS